MAETNDAPNDRTERQLAEALEQLQQQLAEEGTRLAQQRAQYQAVLREAKLARAAANDRSWELADLEQRLRELNEQREGPNDPLLEREIAQLTAQRAQLEERVLAQMLLVDDLTARVQAAELGLTAAQQKLAEREAALHAERDRLAAQRSAPDR